MNERCIRRFIFIETLFVNGLLILAFIVGSLFHFNICKECIYPVLITKPMKILIAIFFIVFCFIAYIGGNRWYYYVVSLAAVIFLISHLVGAGIHEKGIYYHSTGIARFITKLAKWEDISDLTFDRKKNQLKSFKLKKTRIHIGHSGQYDNLENIHEIERFIIHKE